MLRVSREEQMYVVGRDVERQYLVPVLVAHVAETRFQRLLDWFENRVTVLRTPHKVVVDVVYRVVRPLLAHTDSTWTRIKYFSI